MSKQERLVIELVVMAQAAYIRDLAQICNAASKRDMSNDINETWEGLKETLATYFAKWDEPTRPQSDIEFAAGHASDEFHDPEPEK